MLFIRQCYYSSPYEKSCDLIKVSSVRILAVDERLYAYAEPPSHVELVETSRWRVQLDVLSVDVLWLGITRKSGNEQDEQMRSIQRVLIMPVLVGKAASHLVNLCAAYETELDKPTVSLARV